MIGDDTDPGLTWAVRPDGYRAVVVTARRDGRTSTSIMDLAVAATLSDVQLDEEVRWMVGRAVDGLDSEDDG